MENKILKYKLKIMEFFNNMPKELPEFINENFTLVIDDLKGGDAKDIWPVLTMKWIKKYKLSIIGTYNNKNKFIFTTNNKYGIDAPLFKKGSLTTIYTIKDSNSNLNYILRIFSNDETHFLDLPKIKNEYVKYKNYLIKIYFYGLIQTIDNNFILKDETIEKLKDIKSYQFNYIITKTYNTVAYDAFKITNMTNIQKYNFVINNIKLLEHLEKNNEFHTDFKITNVGWDNKDTMDVILIDYDKNTIRQISDDLLIKNKDNESELSFSSSYPPKYIGTGSKPGNYKKFYIKNISQFNKFSVSGLAQIIDSLELKFTKSLIPIPKSDNYHNILEVNTDAISSSIYLNSLLYDEIPTYTQIYNIFIYLKDYLSH